MEVTKLAVSSAGENVFQTLDDILLCRAALKPLRDLFLESFEDVFLINT